jgi:hypothetical protein
VKTEGKKELDKDEKKKKKKKTTNVRENNFNIQGPSTYSCQRKMKSKERGKRRREGEGGE